MELLLKTIPSLALVLGGSVSGRIKLLLELYYFALTRKTFLRGKSHKFVLTFNGTDFTITLLSNVDVAALRELFIDKEYEWDLKEDPQVIVDLGAHYGDTAIYYHLRYPHAKIYAVEPEPHSFTRLQENVCDIAEIVPLHMAISDHEGSIQLNISESSLGHSVMERERATKHVEVPSMTLKGFLQTIGKPDLVKFDIEGAEKFLFIDLLPSAVAQSFIGEVHEDISGQSIDEFQVLFSGFLCDVQPLPQSGRGRYLLKAVRT